MHTNNIFFSKFLFLVPSFANGDTKNGAVSTLVSLDAVFV
jgi:hypothetical protein